MANTNQNGLSELFKAIADNFGPIVSREPYVRPLIPTEPKIVEPKNQINPEIQLLISTSEIERKAL